MLRRNILATRESIDMYVPLSRRCGHTDELWQIAPGPNDLRGPCPGLNVMANHGYLSRDGVASVVQLTTASNEGMSTHSPLPT
jgi:hypothetical protein